MHKTNIPSIAMLLVSVLWLLYCESSAWLQSKPRRKGIISAVSEDGEESVQIPCPDSLKSRRGGSTNKG